MSIGLTIISKGNIQKKILDKLQKEQRRVIGQISRIIRVSRKISSVNLIIFSSRVQMRVATGYNGNSYADQKTSTIYAYLSKGRTSLGFHEMVHILTRDLGETPLFYLEGLATYFDKKWHGESFKKIIAKEFKPRYQNRLIHILSNYHFRALPQKYAYVFSGFAVHQLLKHFGLQNLLSAYKSSKRNYPYKKNARIFKEHFKEQPESYFSKILDREI